LKCRLRLGAIVSANPYYTCGFADKYSQVGLGPARADQMVRAKSVLDRGIPLSYHSEDLPMAPSDPLYLAWCGVNRITPFGRVAGANQRISVDRTARNHHRGRLFIAARKSDRQHRAGQDRQLHRARAGAVAPSKLKDVPTWGTVFEGRLFPVPANQKRT